MLLAHVASQRQFLIDDHVIQGQSEGKDDFLRKFPRGSTAASAGEFSPRGPQLAAADRDRRAIYQPEMRLGLSISLLQLCATATAEDGSEAWLRYRLAPAAVLPSYHTTFAAKLVQVTGAAAGDADELAQLHTAAAELSAGLTQLLGVNVTSSCCNSTNDHTEAPTSGTLHVQVERDTAVSKELGDEGFEIGRTAGGDVQIRAATASGALYGSFHLLSYLQRAEAIPAAAEGAGGSSSEATEATGVAPLRSVPALGLRIWDMWDNLDGTIERGFGGASLIWPMALSPKTPVDQQPPNPPCPAKPCPAHPGRTFCPSVSTPGQCDKPSHPPCPPCNAPPAPPAPPTGAWTAAVAARVEGMARLLKSVGVNGVVLNNVNACGQVRNYR
jgi:hypothetical protein